MAIVDNEDVLNRWPDLASVGGAEIVTSAHIYYAEAEVNAYFANTFTVPFSDNNITAKDFVIDLTYVRAGNLKTGDNEMREAIYKRMADIRDGKASMILVGGTVIKADDTTAWSNTMDYSPVFNMDSTLDFEVDQDQLDAIDDDRN